MEKNEVKQVIVMRSDLKMRKGKCISQGSHSSCMWMAKLIANSTNKKIELNEPQKKWISERFTKIVVSVDSEEALEKLYQEAKSKNVIVEKVIDAGLTEFDGVPTFTCIAIGPDYSYRIDPITQHLKLW